MIPDRLTNQVIELLHVTLAGGKAAWPGSIALELVAEAKAQRQPAEGPELPLVIEHRSRFDSANQPANDLPILLTVSNSPTLFLDCQLNIKRFTPSVREFLNILPSDQGRPLAHLAGRLGLTYLVDDAEEVLHSLGYIEREISCGPDQWYLARLLPYRTPDDKIDGVVMTFVDITRLKEMEARWQRSQQQVESLTQKLETVMTEQTERVRWLASEMLATEQKVQESVAQLLHDELQQLLFSIQMQLDVLHQDLPDAEQRVQEQIRELRETTALALNVTRQVASDLNPPILMNEDFMESLHWLAATMSKRYGLQVTLKGTLPPGCLGREVSVLLFQTVRELLFNAVKHAGIQEAQVKVAEEASSRRLMIEVSDAGQGFEVAAVTAQPHHRDGLGLVNIRNRIELVGGQFHLESKPGQGTRATISVSV